MKELINSSTTVICFLIVLFCSSGCNPFELKPLDIKIVKSEKITARWFHTSDISTVHNHVEIETNRGWIKTMEADGNAYEIYDVQIHNDTVIIQAYKNMFVYQLTSEYWGTHVRLDTSISLYKYMRKFNPKQAKYYSN